MVEPAKWMIDSTPWSSISSATSVWSPTSPTIGSIRCGQRGGKAGREVVEHDDTLAGIDQCVHGMASDIACAAGDQHGHGFLPCFGRSHTGRVYRAGLLRGAGPGQVAGVLNAGYMERDQFERILHVRCAFHQDLLARRRDPSHAGVDRGARAAAGHALRLGGGGGVCAAGAAASGGRRGHSGRGTQAGAQAPWQASTWQEVWQVSCACCGPAPMTRSSIRRGCSSNRR